MSNDRIPQENHTGTTGLNRFLEEASYEARRILGSIQALAGTTSCKGVQIAGLKKWVKSKGCWIENATSLGIFSDRGSENEAYINVDTETAGL